MAQLSTKIKLYCEANSKVADFSNNVILQDDSDGKGAYIKTWSVDGLAKPTDEQIASYETAGNTEESNNKVDAIRKQLYKSWEFQLDEIYHGGIDAWKTRIKSVKDANPKG